MKRERLLEYQLRACDRAVCYSKYLISKWSAWRFSCWYLRGSIVSKLFMFLFLYFCVRDTLQIWNVRIFFSWVLRNIDKSRLFFKVPWRMSGNVVSYELMESFNRLAKCISMMSGFRVVFLSQCIQCTDLLASCNFSYAV